MPAPPLPPAAAQHQRCAAKLEATGDLSGALEAYQTALGLAPADPDLLADVARVAGELDMPEAAAQLWGMVAALDPERPDAVNGQGRALAALGRFDEAVSVLQAGVLAQPGEARLWGALGVVLTQGGQAATALPFLDEAARLDPRSAVALYNRGAARFDLGQLDEAAADFAAAKSLARKPADAAEIAFAAATLLLARGELVEGWDAYEARFAPAWPKATRFDVPCRRWTPEAKVQGKHLLVIAEQGLGDELMFANVLPSLIAELGPEARLTLAVEPRLVSLFARSFPNAVVAPHATESRGPKRIRTVPGLERAGIDYWAPMGSLLRRYRRELSDFPQAAGYLKPDPERVAHWRAWLGEGPPAVGITWRSGMQLADRRRAYPGRDQWRPLLAVPGVRFVNLQYGDCAEELAAFRRESGALILEPSALDIRQDIDDLAALCAALGLVVTVQNATGALAGSVGAKTAFVSGPASWPNLGTAAYPWYPAARCFMAPSFSEWDKAVASAAGAVAALA